jgi:excisionase family DNA binding protein
VTDPSPWLTIDEAADRLKVHVRTIERMVLSGALPEYRHKRTRRYLTADVDAVLARMETDPQD